MARIPIPGVAQEAGQSTYSVAPEIEPQRNLTGLGMQAVGQGLQAVGFEASRVADFLQNQRDDAKTLEADNRAADVIRKYMDDPETGFMHKKGAAASREAREQAFKGIEEELAKIDEGFENDVQREQWHKRVGDRMELATARADEREANGIFEHKWGQTQAMADGARVDGNLQLMKAALNEMSDMAGESKEQRAKRQLAGTTEFHKQQFDLLVSQDAGQAKTYLGENMAEIDPKVRAQMAQKLEVENTKQIGQNMATSLIASAAERGGTDMEQQEFALRALNEIVKEGKGVEYTDQAELRIKKFFHDKAQLRLQAQHDTSIEIKNWLTEDETRSSDDLPDNLSTKVRELGLSGQVAEIEAETRATRAANEQNLDAIRLERDLRTMGALDEFINRLKTDTGETVPDGPQRKQYLAQRKAEAVKFAQVQAQLQNLPRSAGALTQPSQVYQKTIKKNLAMLQATLDDMLKELYQSGK